jgi:hypothetical protein
MNNQHRSPTHDAHARAAPPKRVIVIGAGIAGMTAAHELAERGYEVEVVEKDADPYDATGNAPLLGGMARTSWARVPEPLVQDPGNLLASESATPPSPRPALTPLERDTVPTAVWLSVDPTKPDPGDTGPGATESLKRLIASCQERNLPVSITACTDAPNKDADDELQSAGYGEHLLEALNDRVIKPINAAGISYDFRFVPVPASSHGLVQVAAESARVPGEHGFRFFPSFYRHMFDTMKRIPVPAASLTGPVLAGTVAESDSSRSVFDNLQSSDAIQIALPPVRGGPVRTFNIQRRPLASFEELRRFIANTLELAGYRGEDLYRLATRYVEYMASSSKRRWREYERMSWSDFLGLNGRHHFSSYFRTQVQSGSQALVAMSSDKNDARTIGTVAIALTLDQLRAGDYSDGTLQDPTSTALFWPWQNYLQSLGVTFTRGELVGFVVHGMAVRPAFGRMRENGPVYDWLPIDPADYYVITVPVPNLCALFDGEGKPTRTVLAAETTVALTDKADLLRANHRCLELDALERGTPVPEVRDEIHDNDDATRYFDSGSWLNDPTEHPDAGPLRYMTGIQFYFDNDVRLVNGHTLCLDSPWGVSYLSQVQYWQDRQRGENGVRGVVSAIFTKWEVKYRDKTALECTPDEIAGRVWEQIVAAWDTKTSGEIPDPKYFYIDENMAYKEGRWTNLTPYLVNDLGTWARRPGRRTGSASYEYAIQWGHSVFAGAFMRTATRLNTMEAANESARRAVNAVVSRDARDSGRPPSLCPLWNLEDYELQDFLPLRDLDRRIFARGGRNIVRSQVTEASLRATPWDLVRLGLPTYPDPEADR